MSAAWEELDVQKLVAEAIEADNGPILGTGLAKPLATKAMVARSQSPEEAGAVNPEPAGTSASGENLPTSPEAADAAPAVDDTGVAEVQSEAAGDAAGPDRAEAKPEVEADVADAANEHSEVPAAEEAAPAAGADSDQPEVSGPEETTPAADDATEGPQNAPERAGEVQDVPEAQSAQAVDLRDPEALERDAGDSLDAGVEPAGVPDDVEAAGPEFLDLNPLPDVGGPGDAGDPDTLDETVEWGDEQIWSLPEELKALPELDLRDQFQADFSDTLAGQAPVMDRSGGY